ncbi:MAG: phospho-sugar mutase [Propionibacteriaceae bacterium]|nr:phospho-sugar mutase [Propionibacteriaceae bacterium]
MADTAEVQPESTDPLLLRGTVEARWLVGRRSTDVQSALTPPADPSHPHSVARNASNRWLRVQAWIDADVDELAQAELSVLLERAQDDPDARADLDDRFAQRLQFGTAGLRGAMAAGPNRMNRAVVIQAAHAVTAHLQAHLGSQTSPPVRVVIGNDARHNSRQYALDTAAVVTAAGGDAYLLPDQVPTPVLAYAVRLMDADAGIMVTASHNPAADNGYKVYLGGRMVPENERGVQIVPPHDLEIATLIQTAPPANQIPRSQGWTDCGEEIQASYVARVVAVLPSSPLVGHSSHRRLVEPGSAAFPGQVRATETGHSSSPTFPSAAAPIRIVHTAMHGVGSAPALAALAAAGFTDVLPVEAQRLPDPGFPTVTFPNPEEPGAIDLALSLAAEREADLVIANDPDADRCAVAVPDPRHGWRMLHGDELGAVLADHIGSIPGAGVFVNSVVSSRQMEVIASEYGRPYARTLTGFKWMGRVPGLAFAYEEAIGYCVRPDLVRDKDGLSTAVEVARMVSTLKAQGRTLISVLDDLARRHGLYLSSQLSVRVPDISQMPGIMEDLRSRGVKTLADTPVTRLIDLNQGWDDLPTTDGIALFTTLNDRVIIRPSGTEPKVKCYLEVIHPVDPHASFDDLTNARTIAETRLSQIRSDLEGIVVP